ncbi:MAG: Lrp/AsnC ligand binding domain-containing protein [Planctomycetes bacterium]|nr:Lrp/AsnC ligand binding domain-containing protein [Planctomycetota bacterium]
METAYLKVWVSVGKEKVVVEALRSLPGVLRADLTTGEQDIIALIEAADYPGIVEALLTKVRAVEGVDRTVTNLVLD